MTTSEPTPPPVIPIRVTKRFKRLVKKKDGVMTAAIAECIVRLRTNPDHPGLHTHKMQGHPGIYEAYIDDSNRLTFEWDDGVMVFRANCNHSILNTP